MKPRVGISTTETIVAVILLGVAVSGVLRLSAVMNQGLDDRELRMRLAWELQNARERIGAWSVSEISEERIRSLPVSKELLAFVPDAEFAADWKQIDRPLPAMQISLRLTHTWRGQSAVPQQRTFWIPLPETANEESTASQTGSSVELSRGDNP